MMAHHGFVRTHIACSKSSKTLVLPLRVGGIPLVASYPHGSLRLLPAPVRASSRRAPPTVRTSATPDTEPGAPDWSSVGPTAVLGLVWVGLIAYAFFVAPNFTPMRDQYTIEALVGLSGDAVRDTNPVYRGIFNLMGVWPAIYAGLLIPSARSRSGLPAWPFVMGSFALGMFALLPYMALWEPVEPTGVNPGAPPVKASLPAAVKAMEGPWPWVGAAALAAYQFYTIGTASPQEWNNFLHLLDESRLVHVTCIDFALFSLLAGYWTSHDAATREYEQVGLATALGYVPVVGPLVYLLLRPTDSES